MGEHADDAINAAMDEWLDRMDLMGDFDDEDGEAYCPLLGRRTVVKAKDDEWVTLEREVIKIKDLKTGHLVNILNGMYPFVSSNSMISYLHEQIPHAPKKVCPALENKVSGKGRKSPR